MKPKEFSEIVLSVEGVNPVDLFGEKNVKLNLFKDAYPELKIVSRGNQLKLTGSKKLTQAAKAQLETMVRILRDTDDLSIQMVQELMAGNEPFNSGLGNGRGTTIVHGRDGRPIKAKTRNQKKLFESSEMNDVVFAVGPAGTGKTYTAVAMAVRAMKNRLIKKIILTRPAVEAGESLGFLPGDLKDKVDPYLRPLYDALDDMLPVEKLNYFMANRIIEVAPLAFMRGRTLDNAFIILDEAQNATTTQIKMFLTRLGPSAKCIITGDLSQIDLPFSQKSGLGRAIDLLSPLEGIGVVRLTADDVVRHRLVKQIIIAYDKSDADLKARRKEDRSTPAAKSKQEEE
ncbi:MAG: PhoH family protein [Saprospirales bacterium]|nr:MAG: PhoH family protein [Saprospirales bacterium]